MREAIMLAPVLAAVLCAAPPGRAADYPTKPITLTVGFAQGGPSDVMARVLVKGMEPILKQRMLIHNRPGASGNIAGAMIARAAPDGHAILLATGSILAINPSLSKKTGFDPENDFEPISLISRQTHVLYVHPAIPARSLEEFIAYGRVNPGKLSFGSGGSGTPAHLAGELLKTEAGFQMTHVPFRGAGAALHNVLGGHVPAAFGPPSPLIPHIRVGAIRALATTSLKRTSALREVPTIAERGFPHFEADTWHALVAPAGTPKEAIATLHHALTVTLQDPQVRALFATQGVDIVGNTPNEFRAFLKSEITKWAKIVKVAGLAAVD
jgi:tripartite-type tricarboxylate transporter receptor subunit TctC